MRLVDKGLLEDAVQGAINIMESHGISMIPASVPLATIKGVPTIDAIPVEWIENMLQRWLKGSATLEMCLGITEMLHIWQKEQEDSNK